MHEYALKVPHCQQWSELCSGQRQDLWAAGARHTNVLPLCSPLCYLTDFEMDVKYLFNFIGTENFVENN